MKGKQVKKGVKTGGSSSVSSSNYSKGLFDSIRLKSTKNNNMELLLLLFIILVVGFAIYYFVSIRNQEVDMEGFFNLQDLELSTKSEINKLVKNDKNVVFVFHKMDQCGHCKSFKKTWTDFSKQCKLINNNKPCDDEYKKLKTFVKNKKLTLHCKVVDSSDDLSDDVEGFPELRLYKKNDHISFNGGNRQDEQLLIKFIMDNY